MRLTYNLGTIYCSHTKNKSQTYLRLSSYISFQVYDFLSPTKQNPSRTQNAEYDCYSERDNTSYPMRTSDVFSWNKGKWFAYKRRPQSYGNSSIICFGFHAYPMFLNIVRLTSNIDLFFSSVEAESLCNEQSSRWKILFMINVRAR